ncbi:MAG: molybdenum cofactor biosynthesis protein MoaE [Polyangiaceae bacterium]
MTTTKDGDGRIVLREGALSVDSAIASVAHGGAGAISVFLGTVRNVNDGRDVTLLEYEAYASMATAEMERIRAEIETEIAGARIAAHHRTGALAVGDISVICAASAPHRDEAFRACRLMIDRLKERVPIWKREHGPDGPYWVGWEDARCAPDHGHPHEHK